ncbi:MAG: 4-hydroxythreonine-4-phosphate dehydrogenase PdxA [Deltaproteobacteria bacterium]|nr:4-hydroxythreonine-4-phosphate dehydrogenase PdxA [Deltaproteobacteria bacterium]
MKPKIGIIMGDPAGIGPEITAKSLASPEIQNVCDPMVIGDFRILRKALAAFGGNRPVRVFLDGAAVQFEAGTLSVLDTGNTDPEKVSLGQPSAMGGKAVFEDVSLAVRLAQEKKIDGIVAGPHNKYSVNLSGVSFAGYPPLMAKLTGSRFAFNMLVAGSLRIVGATLHLPLKEISNALTPELVLAVIEAANVAVKRLILQPPKIAVAGLNPHCGEEGLFGTEEKTVIEPAIQAARSKGIDVSGPFPADSLFVGIDKKQDFDAYVAMYHDQSHIPIKTVAFDRIVGFIIGTPLVIATVGHGSAFDIAGKGIASPSPMIETIQLVARSCLPG